MEIFDSLLSRITSMFTQNSTFWEYFFMTVSHLTKLFTISTADVACYMLYIIFRMKFHSAAKFSSWWYTSPKRGNEQCKQQSLVHGIYGTLSKSMFGRCQHMLFCLCCGISALLRCLSSQRDDIKQFHYTNGSFNYLKPKRRKSLRALTKNIGESCCVGQLTTKQINGSV